MLYPDSVIKGFWDLLISVVLIFTCIVTPLRLAFADDENLTWTIINFSIDGTFLVDIFVNFCSALEQKNG